MTIVEKIKALLAKAASTDSQAEAELFLAKAHELMEKHQLDASDLETEDPVHNERTYRRANRGGVDWDFMLLFPVAIYYGCKAIRIEKRDCYEMDLIGRESARITAKEMHLYLVKTVRRLGREAAEARSMPKFDRWGDCVGYMNADQCARQIGNALRERLVQLNAASRKPVPSTPAGKNALVTIDRVLAVYKELHPDAAPIKGRYFTNDNARGIAAGIGLNQQTGHSGGNLQLR